MKGAGHYVGTWLVVLASACAATAQPHVTLPTPRFGSLPNLVPVPAPQARWAALSEAQGLLAFVHDRTYAEAHVSLVKLDAKGNPAPYATAWKLPHPAALGKPGTYALSAAFHPKLPLLYVWQDVNLNNAVPTQPPELKQFDHLLIYNVAKPTPELLVSLCRGDEVLFGVQGGALAVDPAGEFLYVPNLREAKTGYLHLGRFRLDPDGLPLIDEKDSKLPLGTRAKKLTDLNAAKGVVPAQQTPIEYVYVFANNAFGVGQSFHVVSSAAVVSSGQYGVLTWRPDDKVAPANALPLKTAGNFLIGAHPTAPYVFATGVNADSFFRVGLVDGTLTLLPLQITLTGTRLFSAPVAIDKGKRLAIGGHYCVYVVTLDAKSEPQPDPIKVRVLSAAARAVVYSERWNRLYVGVEQSR